jgi:hypothetical protein
MVGTLGVSPDALRCPARIALTPAFAGYLPVSRDALDGEQTGEAEYIEENLIPSFATASMLGVLKSVAPIQLKSP